MGYSVNPMVAQVPELAREWHPTKNQSCDPSLTSSGSPRTYWWQCANGHEYERSALLQSRGVRCSTCLSVGYKHQVLVEYWDFEQNTESIYSITPGSSKKVYWLCPSKHSILRSPAKVIVRGLCCVAKSDGTHRKSSALRVGENDLKTMRPDLLSYWSPNEPSKPDEYLPNSLKKVLWRCHEFDHDYEMAVGNKTKGYGCPFCSNRRVLAGFNDLGTTRPELLIEWHPKKNEGLEPSSIAGNSNIKCWWLCSKGHEWIQSPNGRHTGGGCPVCSNQKLMAGFNDLESVDPRLADEWDSQLNFPLAPSDVLFGSNIPVWWRCRENLSHSWKAAPSTRRKGHGCPYCAGISAVPGETDITTTHPELALEIDRLFHSEEEISLMIAGTGKKVHWVCRNFDDHKFVSNGAKRVRGNSCPICSSHQVLPGFNDLSTRNPALAAEWDYQRNAPLTPEQVTSGSNKKIHWICSRNSGHRWSQRPSVRRWTGCPECAPGGFSSVAPGTLYFLENPEYLAMKVGITATRSNRISNFISAGWVVIQTWDFPLGSVALEVETLFFRWLRKDIGLPVYLGELEMGALGGFSETFESETVSPKTVISTIDKIAEQTMKNLAIFPDSYE